MSEATPSWAAHNFGRPRVVTACVPCRRRKVKCDHAQPVCSACKRGDRECTYTTPQPNTHNSLRSTGSGISRQRSSLRNGQDEIRSRLDRLERLLEQALNKNEENPSPTTGHGLPRESPNGASPTNTVSEMPSSTLRGETLSADNYDGALLLDSRTGQSRWVSSLHYALLADQIHDVKMLLGEQTKGISAAESMSLDHPSPQFPFSGTTVEDLTPWLPGSAQDCFGLLDIFFTNVDPVARIVHKPSLRDHFTKYIQHTFGAHRDGDLTNSDANTSLTAHRTFEPMAFAVIYAAVNSLTSESVMTTYNMDKDALLVQLQRGLELGLGRENLLTTSSIEVLQAFVLLLTCQSREDDMARTWSFLGLAERIALSQGLHREPSLFPSENMDVVQVELRRRLWHQICYLDFRSAESTGQEPTISDNDFTTLLPRNINDQDLQEGFNPLPETYSAPGFTDMSGHLIRLHGIHCFRKITKSTYQLERRLKSSMIFENSTVFPINDFQAVFADVRVMIDEMKAHIHSHYLAFCDPEISEHRLALGLAVIIEWRCWSTFWLRTPKQYREALVSPEIRQIVLDSSISLMESMNMMPEDKDAKKFQWHIGGHSCFQAIMHIVSELETPEFKAPQHEALRTRALSALQATVNTRGRETSPTWNVINRIISNCLNKNSPSSGSSLAMSETSGALSRVRSDDHSNPTAFTHEMPEALSAAAGFTPGTDIFADLTGLESLYMQDPPADFDWGFFNVDHAR